MKQGLAAIRNIAMTDANCEALRPHIGVIVGLVQEHARDAEVTEAGLVTVVCIICSMYASCTIIDEVTIY